MCKLWVKTAIVLFILVTAHGKRSKVNRKTSLNRYEELKDMNAVVVTTCDVRCRGKSIAEKEQCHNRCLSSNEPKAGSCPSSFQQISIFAKACLHICTHDFQCAHTEKCCEHSCGITCQPAQGLEKSPYLPAVPRNVTAKEHKGNNVIQIQWTYNATSKIDRSTLYLIENRSHFGKYFDEESLGPWTPFYQAADNPATVRGLVQTAHWYIFRVAAVNVNGTVGFSLPSQPLFFSKVPAKPGTPKNLHVTKVREVNHTIWGELRWKRPKSDVPIESYRVYWSWRLPGNSSESLMRNKSTVAKSRAELKYLQKNELYYIQVQAIAIYGNEKLRGAKGELFFNTTLLQDQFATSARQKSSKKPSSKS